MAADKSRTSPAIHNITFCGLTGAIFVLLTASVVLYIEAFVTTSWTVVQGNETASTEYEGLWQRCIYRAPIPRNEFVTSQILVSVGLFGVIASFILSTIYMTANRTSKNVTITSLAFVCFVTVVFIVIGVTMFGLNKATGSQLSWSYYVTVASAALALLAGILAIAQLRRSNVRVC